MSLGSLLFSGLGCRSITLHVPVDGRRARDVLVEPFTLFAEASGKALLAVRVTAYGKLSLEGRRALRSVVCELALRIEPPRRNGGAHFFLLSQATNDRRLARALEESGIRCDLLDRLGLEERDLDSGRGRALAAGEPLPAATCSILARVAEPLPAAGSSRSVLWSVGPQGIRQIRCNWNLSAGAIASGQVFAAPDSRLALLGGGEVLPGAGFYARFDASGSVAPEGADSETEL